MTKTYLEKYENGVCHMKINRLDKRIVQVNWFRKWAIESIIGVMDITMKLVVWINTAVTDVIWYEMNFVIARMMDIIWNIACLDKQRHSIKLEPLLTVELPDELVQVTLAKFGYVNTQICDGCHVIKSHMEKNCLDKQNGDRNRENGGNKAIEKMVTGTMALDNIRNCF